MLPLLRELRLERPPLWLRCALGRTIWQSPYRGSTIAVLGFGPDWITGLEGEVRLDVVDGRVVVVLDLAQLQEASGESLSNLISLHKHVRCALSWQTGERVNGVRKDSLFAALRRIVHREVDGDVADRGLQ